MPDGPDPPDRTGWVFDASTLATWLRSQRAERGWSTRTLAARAGISQPYVVALERAAATSHRPAPSPTLEVVARLADAFAVSPHVIMANAVVPRGHHVVLVTGDALPTLARVERASAASGVSWLWAGRELDGGAPDKVRIDPRRDQHDTYRPDALRRQLVAEIADRTPGEASDPLGIVFAETSHVMTTVATPETILALEHSWADLVHGAAAEAGRRVAWNVCVYQLGHLRSVPDPVAAVRDLLVSHDAVWFSTPRRIISGRPAAEAVLAALQPAGTDALEWAAESARLLDSVAA